jgi:uncharacterized protein
MSTRTSTDEVTQRRIESPCIGVCVIEPNTDLCEGCFRTLDEVAGWGTSSASERREILDRVEQRRDQRRSGTPV